MAEMCCQNAKAVAKAVAKAAAKAVAKAANNAVVKADENENEPLVPNYIDFQIQNFIPSGGLRVWQCILGVS
jgi:hypothetical protein